jgi:hypothetical protein
MDEIDLSPQDGHRKLTLRVGNVLYRVVAFDDGTLRFWNVGSVRPVGANSVIIEPLQSERARAMADMEAQRDLRNIEEMAKA